MLDNKSGCKTDSALSARAMSATSLEPVHLFYSRLELRRIPRTTYVKDFQCGPCLEQEKKNEEESNKP